MKAFKLLPALKQTIWGGQKLKSLYGGEDMDNIAESWVLSCHAAGPSVVSGGLYDGLTLPEALAQCGEGVLGSKVKNNNFPVLIKLIDAADKLSIQVHPNDAYAHQYENDNGKTESWVILDADENAELIFGVNRELSKEEFRSHIENNTLQDVVKRVPVKKGDVAFIPAGTLHAIGGGILLAEVQQSSDVTYRVYDYGRLQNGRPRELHIEKALEVTSLTPSSANFAPCGETKKGDGFEQTLLVSCPYFTMERIEISSHYSGKMNEESFLSLLVTEGVGEYAEGKESLPLKKGDSLFLPAGNGDFAVKGKLELLKTGIS